MRAFATIALRAMVLAALAALALASVCAWPAAEARRSCAS